MCVCDYMCVIFQIAPAVVILEAVHCSLFLAHFARLEESFNEMILRDFCGQFHEKFGESP